ncbi:MAG TPA: helix-turn-helix domain-containing protein [Solirubrobacteraceae bacterium]|nr:helix-turn-helix domain-containing protein [Solirubrobacteraceae bacterium]
MATAAFPSRIRLLEVDPDLGLFLSDEELSEARRAVVASLLAVGGEKDVLDARLQEHHAFAALLIDGMVLEQVQVGDQVGMRLLGPGDVVSRRGGDPSILVAESSVRAAPGTHLALLGVDFLLAIRHWPGLVTGLELRNVQQAERLTTQLVICQLPRVDQRVLAVMWLLAESWGRVTPAGATLPLRLTHDALGALIGARRPTVAVALRDLAERGAIIRQDQGWLLLEAPPGATRPVERFRRPSLIDDRESRGLDPAAPARAPDGGAPNFILLTERLAELRVRYETDRVRFDERLRTVAANREQCQETRVRVSNERLSRSRSRPS